MTSRRSGLGAPWTARLLRLLDQHVPDLDVWVYGSRLGPHWHDGSDLDLVLVAASGCAVPGKQLAALREALRESELPILVDVHDWSRVSAEFQKEILSHHQVLRPRLQTQTS